RCPRRAFSLEPCCHIHYVTTQVSSIGNRVTNVDADPKADGPVRGRIIIMDRELLLHLQGAADRSINAIKHDEQRVTSGLDDPAAMFFNRWVNQSSAQSPQSFEGSNITEADHSGIARHVGIHDGDQLAPILRLFNLARWPCYR